MEMTALNENQNGYNGISFAADGTIEASSPGWYTVDIQNTVRLKPGKRFMVVVQVTTPTGTPSRMGYERSTSGDNTYDGTRFYGALNGDGTFHLVSDNYNYSIKAVTVPARYTVTYDANGGKGTMEGFTAIAGTEYTLPENTFTAPEYQRFKAWKIG